MDQEEPQQQRTEGSKTPRRLKLPDPNGWKIEVLKGEHTFHRWRDTFELQIGTIWTAIDKLLLTIRDEEEVFTEERYQELVTELELVTEECNKADWQYQFVSRKLYMVLDAYSETGPKKVIRDSIEKCGFEAYRLLSR